jgi:hypothetical protein
VGGAPLIDLEEAWIFGMWPKRLLIFEDRIETRDFELLREKVESREYARIRKVAVSDAGWLATLVVPIQGSSPILIRGLSKDDAERTRALTEERMGWANSSPSQTPSPPKEGRLIQGVTELRHAGILREEEFEIKRKEVMRANTDLERSRDEG